METAIEKLLNVKVKKFNRSISGGCINKYSVYQTADKQLLFVKDNLKDGADKMFQGELEGLKAIISTNTVLAPSPICVGSVKNSRHFIVLEYLDLELLDAKCSAVLGSQLADMHLHNLHENNRSINHFGFHVETSCGFYTQNNSWNNNWLTFYTENRLNHLVNSLLSNSKSSPDNKKVLESCWSRLKQIIHKFFEGIDVKPSILHGDLWSGNAAQTNSKPIIFDPATFYGHHEYDIASTTLFGGYPSEFYDTYFKKIPKAKGFENRMSLYRLYHYLNHWNHFGEVYMTQTINNFEELFNVYK